ncbi:deoxynucleotidyltransferase terminal-interacting protein 2 [Elysia marginata]|uniref:Deoxynucleotidyltransferase terminal-interacting protein 2 n=1 Tax=Elysia marginata TaxID=1093978 RepID=A0AAV4HF87_9GAST|nr:deoxynucleotidyltransferase terminal-interacting protein 2 [Elysia marginata]
MEGIIARVAGVPSRACYDRVFVGVSVADLFLHGGVLAQRTTVFLHQGRRASNRYFAELIPGLYNPPSDSVATNPQTSKAMALKKKEKSGIPALKSVDDLVTVKKDDSSISDSDSMSSNSSENVSSEPTSPTTESQCNKDLAPAFTLSCFRSWSSKKMEECFRDFVSKRHKKKTVLNIGIPKLSKIEDFTPWWDEFVKPSKKLPANTQVDTVKDADSFNNWFDKSHPESSSSSWLSGPGLSKVPEKKSAQLSAPVEDIEVPSIYNQTPKTKGRRALKRDRKAEKEKTLGKRWFEMRAPEVDDNTRMDMEMIRMRGVLDPKRFYKHNDRGALPKYFQMGTVVDEGTDFYSSRLTKKQRKQTLVEELMADANIRQYNKRKYSEVQQKMRNKKFKGKKTAAS